MILAGLGAAAWGCQGPQTFLRAIDAGGPLQGTGGAVSEGTGGAPGTGGKIVGTGGRSGTGGLIASQGSGGASGTGGRAPGTGGVVVAGTGGIAPGAGGAIADGGQGTGGAPITPCTACLAVQIECKGGSTQQVKFSLQLVNKTTMPIAYSTITVRYWAKIDQPNQAVTFTCDYAQNAALQSAASGKFGTSGSNQYLEVAFPSATASLAAGASSGEIQARFEVHDPGWNATPTDDYTSMSGCPTAAFMDWDRITGYVGGTLVWGTEPTTTTAAGDAGAD